MPYRWPAHTVVETPEFLIAAKAAGVTDAEREDAIEQLARHPYAGAVIPARAGRARFGLPERAAASPAVIV